MWKWKWGKWGKMAGNNAVMENNQCQSSSSSFSHLISPLLSHHHLLFSQNQFI